MVQQVPQRAAASSRAARPRAALLAAGLASALVATPQLALAEAQTCQANIQGARMTLAYNDASDVFSSRRERWTLDKGECPAKVVMGQLSPELTAKEREVFCLEKDPVMGFSGLAVGERDAYGMCRNPHPGRACKIVNASKDEARQVASATAGAGMQAVRHQGGALVASGSSATLMGTLSGLGTAAATVMSAPLALAGAAASVVVVGGAVWVCGGSEAASEVPQGPAPSEKTDPTPAAAAPAPAAPPAEAAPAAAPAEAPAQAPVQTPTETPAPAAN